jgi:transposase-like protein
MTVWIAVVCPDCNSTDVVKNGKTPQRKQRYLCQNQECPRRTFIIDYTHDGYKPEVKQKITEMAVNGSGIRDTARVLSISTHTVMKELKKRIINRKS